VNIEAILAMKELSRKKLQDTSSELRGWYDTTGGFGGGPPFGMVGG
jgi:hypothetical protein